VCPRPRRWSVRAHARRAARTRRAPDLARALCGSEGTIGFITSAGGCESPSSPRPAPRRVTRFRSMTPQCPPSISRCARSRAVGADLDAAEARAHSMASCSRGPRLLCAGTAVRPISPHTIRSDHERRTREGGLATDTALAELWWRRLRAGEPTPGDAPNSSSWRRRPSSARSLSRGHHQLATQGGSARAHISRFDADGAVAFFTLLHAMGPPSPRSSPPPSAPPRPPEAGCSVRGAHKLDRVPARDARGDRSPRMMTPARSRRLRAGHRCAGVAAADGARGCRAPAGSRKDANGRQGRQGRQDAQDASRGSHEGR